MRRTEGPHDMSEEEYERRKRVPGGFDPAAWLTIPLVLYGVVLTVFTFLRVFTPWLDWMG